jgi:hypothetical protein
MNTHDISTAAVDLVGKFGNTAHHIIGLYREGGERFSATLGQRWHSALKQSSAKLTPETRKNAARAQKAFGAWYAKGLATSAGGAEVAVDALVGATVAAIVRASQFAEQNVRKTA